jgi:hypothetical protein
LRSIPTNEVVALSDTLRGSGLELPDEVRRDCNRYIAGKWLFDFLHASGRTQDSADTLETLAPEVAATCENASLAAATVVKIPDPRFPRLNADASPYRVWADGTYQRVRDIKAEGIAGIVPDYRTHKVKVQLSHWSQLLDLPLPARLALSSADST